MSKEAIELILERTLADVSFRTDLFTDPQTACVPFDLTEAEFHELLGQAFPDSKRLPQPPSRR